MKNNSRLLLKTLLILTAILSIGWTVSNNTNEEKSIVVLVKYKTQNSKDKEAIEALNSLIEKVRKEPHFVSIKLHVDPNDRTNILLYEEWSDAYYYSDEHMKTVHLQQFIQDSRAFLAGPPEISFWKVEREYK